MDDRTALVTGATSGIGMYTVLGLARAGVRVLAVGRDPARLEQLRIFIARRAPRARLELLQADLSRLACIAGLAADVRARTKRLDLLINNAGLLRKRREVTPEGHELTLAVNYLAPFLLTGELLDLLEAASPGARIVNVGSQASDRAALHLDNLQSARAWTTMRAYGQAKLALMIWTFELARRLEGRGITANVVHPGVVATRVGDLGGAFGFAWMLAKPFLLNAAQGAEATLHAALSPAMAGVTGRYFKRNGEATPNRRAGDRLLAAELWARTERLVGGASPTRRFTTSPSQSHFAGEEGKEARRPAATLPAGTEGPAGAESEGGSRAPVGGERGFP
jgi:NAD(P)-dependent dehydrogenase (short-subunit alcohol dehydrogenase family)